MTKAKEVGKKKVDALTEAGAPAIGDLVAATNLPQGFPPSTFMTLKIKIPFSVPPNTTTPIDYRKYPIFAYHHAERTG